MNPQAERGREPKQPCKYGERINNMARPAPDTVPEQWIERCADSERKLLVVGEKP